MSTTTLINAEEFAQMSFDSPVELIRGEIVEMTRPGGIHGRVCFNVNRVFVRWPNVDSGYGVYSNDTGFLTERDPDSVRGPDLAVVREDVFADGRIPQGVIRQSPELCVEVRSPSDRWSEVLGKVGEFLDAGVKEVWVVDPVARRVHVYVAGGDVVILRQDDTLKSVALPDLEFRISELFRGLPSTSDNPVEQQS
jgi:Uma2 family endonuclease